MKKPKVYVEREFRMDDLIYTGGTMTGKSEAAFVAEAINQGIKHFPDNSIYYVTGECIPGINTNAIYGQIIPNDGYDRFREFCSENIPLITYCIRNEKMIFPFLEVGMDGIYSVRLCGEELSNRAIAHTAITSYAKSAADVFSNNHLVFSPEHLSQTKFISLEAICDDISVGAINSAIASAMKVNLAAYIRYEILFEISMQADHLGAMEFYQVVFKLMDMVNMIAELGDCGVCDKSIAEDAKHILTNIMDSCTVVRFVDASVADDGVWEETKYTILEAEKISAETLKDAGNLFARYSGLLAKKHTGAATTSDEESSKTKAVKKTTATKKTTAKKSTTRTKKSTTKKAEGEEKNENEKSE